MYAYRSIKNSYFILKKSNQTNVVNGNTERISRALYIL